MDARDIPLVVVMCLVALILGVVITPDWGGVVQSTRDITHASHSHVNATASIAVASAGISSAIKSLHTSMRENMWGLWFLTMLVAVIVLVIWGFLQEFNFTSTMTKWDNVIRQMQKSSDEHTKIFTHIANSLNVLAESSRHLRQSPATCHAATVAAK